ncbi:MAG: hypothetical protein ABJF10_05360 [Chthoniobacter sp.]|uniref:hypothetical protein n=1 Tax=Chthoniobacter sp. TaxID=2510640 RepID=UPI0032A9B4DC
MSTAFVTLCGWTLAATGHLDARGYATGFFCGGVLLLLWGRQMARRRAIKPRRFTLVARRWWRPLPLAFALLFFLICAGATLHPPNNYDALTYRVPQIMHWIAEGRWHWIPTNSDLLNISPPGYGWLMAPTVVFFKTDRFFALPNVIAFALLPGLFFSAARQCGMHGRVAWMWMWIVPATSCLATQAGSIGNDLLPGVYALAALAFGLRARRSGSWPDFCLSALAAALITGVKITAAPLALPWLIATLPCWRAVRYHWLGAAAVAVVAVAISYVPTAAINSRQTGSWNGDPGNQFKVQPDSPVQGIVGNSFMILAGALEPSVCPVTNIAKARFQAFQSSGAGRWITAKFPRFALSWGELATEESSGLGLGVFLLTVISVVAASWHGRPCASPAPVWQRWVRGAVLLAFGAFLAKMGSEAAARLAAPYYPPLLIGVLSASGHEWVTRQTWWRVMAVAVVVSILPAVVLSPSRPLWPAQPVLAALAQSRPGNAAIQRAQTVYSVYARRDDFLAPLKAQLPAEAQLVGFIPNLNDLEGTLWKPYGSRKIVEVLTASPADPALAFLRGSAIITSRRALDRFHLTPEAYAVTIHGKITASAMITQKVALGLEEWVIISIDDPATGQPD